MSVESFNNEADGTAPESEVTAAPETEDNGTPGEQESQEPRTFTQEELDAKIGEAKAKLERKLRREMSQAAEAQRPAMDPPQPAQYKSIDEYADALAEYKADQKIAEREARQQRTQVETTYDEREDNARAKYSDFQRVVYNDDLRITEVMVEAIKTSEIGPDVAYHLGKNPDEALRISRLAPVAQVREIGKIEAKLATNPNPVKKVSSAPDPITPVGSRSSSPKYDPTDPRSVDSMSASEWIEARNKKLRAQG